MGRCEVGWVVGVLFLVDLCVGVEIKKCCGEGEWLSLGLKCESSGGRYNGTLLERMVEEGDGLGYSETLELNRRSFGPPECGTGESVGWRRVRKVFGMPGGRVGVEDNVTGRYGMDADRICIEGMESSSEVFAWMCNPLEVPECDGFDTFCLRKCCGLGEVINSDLFMCQRSNESVGMSTEGTVGVDISRSTHFGQPHCEGDSYEIDFTGSLHLYNRLEILPSGNLFLETKTGETEVIPWTQFCVDEMTPGNKTVETRGFLAVVCYPGKSVQEDSLQSFRRVLYPLLFSISSVFLLATCVVYLILWKDLNLPGWLQFSYVSSLFVGFTLLAVVQMWSGLIYDASHTLCRLVGYSLHGTFLSSFFWLTCMNIDLWCSFKHTPIITSFGRSRAKRRYVGFGVVSTLIPVGVTLAAVFVDDLTRKVRETEGVPFAGPFELVSTGIGKESCALNVQDKLAMLYYFYGVVGVLLLVNLMFFFCTVLCLRERQRETKFAHRQSTAAADPDVQRFKLFTRLFFIMGVLWIFELISWLVSFFSMNEGIQKMFVLTDSLNALQGLAIFVIFVWKPQTWRQLRKKWRKTFGQPGAPQWLLGIRNKSSMTSSSMSTKSSSIVSKVYQPQGPQP